MPPKEEEPQSKEEAQPVVKQARHGWFHFIDELQFWSEFYIFACLCPVCFVHFCALVLSLLGHYSVHLQVFYSTDSRCIDAPSSFTLQFGYNLRSPERQEGAIVRLQTDIQTSEDRNPCNRKCHPKRRNHNPKKRLSKSWSRHATGDFILLTNFSSGLNSTSLHIFVLSVLCIFVHSYCPCWGIIQFICRSSTLLIPDVLMLPVPSHFNLATICAHLSVKRGLLCGCKLTSRRVKIEIPATGNATQRGGTTIQRRGSASREAGTPRVISFYWRTSVLVWILHLCISLSCLFCAFLCISIVLAGALFSSFAGLLLYWFQMYWCSQFLHTSIWLQSALTWASRGGYCAVANWHPDEWR